MKKAKFALPRKKLDSNAWGEYDKRVRKENDVEMEEKVRLTYLYDFYGELLNERQQRLLEQHLFEDLSFSEIAEREDLTRQGVFDLVSRSEKKLLAYEEKLKLFEKFQSAKEKLEAIVHASDDPQIKALAQEIMDSF